MFGCILVVALLWHVCVYCFDLPDTRPPLPIYTLKHAGPEHSVPQEAETGLLIPERINGTQERNTETGRQWCFVCISSTNVLFNMYSMYSELLYEGLELVLWCTDGE